MRKTVLAARFDLPFYLRLPSSGFFTWEPEFNVAVICPSQKLGDVSFKRNCSFVNPELLLDAACSPTDGRVSHKVKMTCQLESGVEIPTLQIDTGNNGGFSELRAYTDLTIFITVCLDEPNKFSDRNKERIFEVLNHFINIYRIITQDPHVYRIDQELDTYLIDYSIGTVPDKLQEGSAEDILKNLNEIQFPREVGERRQLKYRLNTLEDLFPGKLLEDHYKDLFIRLIRNPYNIPLHYELIFAAQVELKKRRYHIAIMEAETAFETYIAYVLIETSVAVGIEKNSVLEDMEYPGKLCLLSPRLKELDSLIKRYRSDKGLNKIKDFVESATHSEWKTDLYTLRNKIVHEGWRPTEFDLAKKAIASCKVAIKAIEDRLPGIANNIQIYPGVEHLKNTAGRLQF